MYEYMMLRFTHGTFSGDKPIMEIVGVKKRAAEGLRVVGVTMHAAAIPTMYVMMERQKQ
jgi:hypothetical protein